MIAKFDPGALYSRQALRMMLKPLGIDPDAFIARLRPVKRFRMAWLGADLLRAMESAPPLRDGETDAPAISTAASAAPARGGRKPGEDPGLERLRRMARGEE